MKHSPSGFCAVGHHEMCPGRTANGSHVALGLDTKGNPTRAPRPYGYCGCKRCDHFPEERAAQDAAEKAFNARHTSVAAA